MRDIAREIPPSPLGLSPDSGLEPRAAEQPAIAAVVPKFSVDIHRLRNKFCKEGEPYILKNDTAVEGIMACLYHPPADLGPDYYRLKTLELLLYLNAVEIQEGNRKEIRFFRSSADKLREIRIFISSTCIK